MKESKLFKKFVVTFVVTVLGGPAVVLANPISYIEVGKASVSYADLNLESEEGVRVLYRRLQYASKVVCSSKSLKITLSPFVNYQVRGCYRHTLSDAVNKVDNEALTHIHAG